MAGDNNAPISSFREKMSANHEFNFEQFDDTVVEQVMQRLENVPQSAHNEIIEQFLFEYYYGNKSQPTADSDGNISEQRLQELTAHAYLIETSLKLRDHNYTAGPEGPTLAAICIEKYSHIGRYLLNKWESYEGTDRQERIDELREALQYLLDCARVFTGTGVRFEFHQGFALILHNMENIDTLLPLPISSSQPSSTD